MYNRDVSWAIVWLVAPLEAAFSRSLDNPPLDSSRITITVVSHVSVSTPAYRLMSKSSNGTPAEAGHSGSAVVQRAQLQ
jgi:hypothetical protein